MSKTPKFDAKITEIHAGLVPHTRTCEMTGNTWNVDEREIEVLKRFSVPPVDVSPMARLWQTGSFFDVYQWWWNQHAETGKPVLSGVHPGSGIRVLPDKEWFEKDFSENGIEYDLDQSFFDQFRKLQLAVPVNATRNWVEPENSIAKVSMEAKDSYFVSASSCKDSFYLNDSQEADHSAECLACITITDSYQLSHCNRMHKSIACFESHDCIESAFLFDCRNCEYCFGATNQRNKKYLWFNEQLSKEEWEKRRSNVDLGSHIVFRDHWKQFYGLLKAAVWPENFNIGSEACIGGDYLIKCSNNYYTSYGRDGHNNYYNFGAWSGSNSAFSCTIFGENCFQSGPTHNSSNCKFSGMMIRCDACEYSFNCYDSTNCFGCVGLRHKKFHIFNKPYSEEEYWKRVDELKCAMLDKGEYGYGFPTAFSPAYYPEGGQMMYLGAQLEDWDKVGMPRYDIDAESAFGPSRVNASDMKSVSGIPDHINDVDESWVGKPIMDDQIKRPYTYLKPELAFYKKINIAAPRKHFTSRMKVLMLMQNSGFMEDKSCNKCSASIIVGKNPTFRDRTVYCKTCYSAFIESRS